MHAIQNIVCPVDFSSESPHQAALAASLSRLCHARLVLHHHLAGLAPGSGVGWMWSAAHQGLTREAAESRLEELARDAAPGLAVARVVTEGSSALAAMLAVSDAHEADLIVLSTHGVSAQERESLTELVLARAHRSVLALHPRSAEPHALGFDFRAGHLQRAVVPTDLTRESRPAVLFAFELARTLPLELWLVHVLARHGDPEREAAVQRELKALVPGDLAERVHTLVRAGDPQAGIAAVAGELGAACVVMGEHTQAPIRKWFSHDTSRGVLQAAPCPVWYVPALADALAVG